jgi:ABC-type thiamine transport system substrate-binding protein
MTMKYLIISILLSTLFVSSGCVETVKENSFQSVHVFTDLPDSLTIGVFDEFEKQSNIHVFLHHASSDYILENLKTEKWQSKADLVLLKNALDLINLTDERILHAQPVNEDTVFWQPLFHNPFVFNFPQDTVPLFTSYGQLIRNKDSRVDAKLIRSFDKWGNLIPSLKKNYLIFSLEEIQSKILYSDSLKGKDIMYVQIAPYSHFKKTDKIVFPDQFFKGAYGIIGGIAMIKQAKNRSNSQLLYNYCEMPAWRKKLAKKINLFPILDDEANKAREILLYQSPPNLKEIKNSAD